MMNSFNFINSPILIAGYIVCLVLLILSFIKVIKFNYIFIISLLVLLVGLSIYSLIIGTAYVEVICFATFFFFVSLFHLKRKKEER